MSRSLVPLLRKELIEQSNRKRTYIIRMVYATFLFVCFIVFFNEHVKASEGNLQLILGTGVELFRIVVRAQFWGIYLFLPAMMAGVITYEKERDSLSLLLLTDLGPWEILLQKYFGRLVPMFGFLLLSLPMLAVAYSFGGISLNYVELAVYLLFLACLQVGAFSLALSAYCRTTFEAFVASYIGGALAFVVFSGMRILLPSTIFEDAEGHSILVTGFRSVLVLVFIVLVLVRARKDLVRRAFLAPYSPLLRAFKKLDGFWNGLNDRFAGGIVLLKDHPVAVADAPVAWRELTKRALGKTHYLGRIILLVEAFVVFFGVAALQFGGPGWSTFFASLVAVLWAGSVLVVTVQSANALGSERSAQTLDVLLATPLEGSDILVQKLRGVRKLIVGCTIPFATLFLIRAFTGHPSADGEEGPLYGVAYVAFSMLTVLVYLPMFAWLAMWIGLRIRSRTRAILMALGAAAAWILAPLVVAHLAYPRVDRGVEWMHAVVSAFSPAWAVYCTEMRGVVFLILMLGGVSFLWHLSIYILVRRLCLGRADRYLGRAEPQQDPPDPDAVPELAEA